MRDRILCRFLLAVVIGLADQRGIVIRDPDGRRHGSRQLDDADDEHVIR